MLVSALYSFVSNRVFVNHPIKGAGVQDGEGEIITDEVDDDLGFSQEASEFPDLDESTIITEETVGGENIADSNRPPTPGLFLD